MPTALTWDQLYQVTVQLIESQHTGTAQSHAEFCIHANVVASVLIHLFGQDSRAVSSASAMSDCTPGFSTLELGLT